MGKLPFHVFDQIYCYGSDGGGNDDNGNAY